MWIGDARPYSFALSNAIRRLLLGEDPAGAVLSARATERIASLREEYESRVSPDATVVEELSGRLRWWTFAGGRANAVLAAALEAGAPELLDEGSFSNLNVAVRSDATAPAVAAALRRARSRLDDDLGGIEPAVSEQALKRLKFSELLPPTLARRTLAVRSADHRAAGHVAASPITASTRQDPV